MIRRAEIGDVPQIVDIGAAFLAYSPHRDIPLDREAFGRFAEHLIEQGVIYLTTDGFIGGLMVPAYFNPSVLIATELFWWAPTKGEGQPLKAQFEAWAMESGAYAITFSALLDDRQTAVDRIYRRSGFNPVETAYLKVL